MSPAEQTQPEAGNPKPPLLKRLRPLLLLLGISFFAYFALQSWDTTQAVLRNTAAPLFFASVLLAVVDNILFCMLFSRLLAKNGLPLPATDVGQMYFFGQISKYIPGKFWNLLYHSTFSKTPGSGKAIIAANIDLTALAILRNSALGLVLVLFLLSPWMAGVAFCLSMLLFIGGFRARFAEKLVIWSSRLLPGMNAQQSSPRQHTSLSHILLLYCATWLVFLACNHLLLASAFDLNTRESILFVAYLSLAWVVGVVAFIVPAGFGIREAAFVLLATRFGSSDHTTAMLTAIAVIYRLWQMCHELVGLCIGLMLQRYQRHNAQ